MGLSAPDWAARPASVRPWVIGHRGAAGAATENTLEAFAEAERQGAEGVEFDVRPCGSGELAVLHDETLTRVTGGADGRAASRLGASELRSARLLGGERVPFADEAIDWALSRGLLVNVELKRDTPRRAVALTSLARLLARFAFSPALLVSSFDPTLLVGLRTLAPRARVGLLFEGRGPGRWALGPLVAAALHPERSLVTAERVAAARRRGVLVCTWTVNEPHEARRLAEAGVDAIISDRPGELRRALGGAAG